MYSFDASFLHHSNSRKQATLSESRLSSINGIHVIQVVIESRSFSFLLGRLRDLAEKVTASFEVRLNLLPNYHIACRTDSVTCLLGKFQYFLDSLAQ